MATSTQHQEISGLFLDHAAVEFEKGDFLQASEKAWGAVAHYVKSVAKEQGWPDGSHRDVNRNAEELIKLTPDPGTNRTKLVAMNGLHSNFCEGNLGPEHVEKGIEDARDLVADMKKAEARLPRLESGRARSRRT